MKSSTQYRTIQRGAVSLLCLVASLAQAESVRESAQKNYELEVVRCHSGVSGQALDTCLKEAAAAKLEAQKTPSAPVDDAVYKKNLLKRCEVFNNASDRLNCIARTNQAPSQGTVEGGGVLREYIEIVPQNLVNP